MYNQIPKEVEQAILSELSYDPLSGEFTWKRPGRGRRRDGKAGSKHSLGYTMLFIKVDGVDYNLLAHRVAWFMSYGEWPKFQIDHINQVKDDNRLVNLRDVTQSKNLMNRGKYLTNTQTDRRTITHGLYVGVDQMKSGRWRAICGGKYLGCFDTPEEAALAYNKRAKELYGNFAHQNDISLLTTEANRVSVSAQTKE